MPGIRLEHRVPGTDSALPDPPKEDLGVFGTAIDVGTSLVALAIYVGIPLFVVVWLITAVISLFV